jgi:hypothetical protein
MCGWCPPHRAQTWEQLACSGIARVGSRSRISCGRRYVRREGETGRGKDGFKVRALFADVRCTRPTMDSGGAGEAAQGEDSGRGEGEE